MMLGNTGAFLTGKLPYDAEVEYLESTGGTTYMLLPIQWNSTSHVEVTWQRVNRLRQSIFGRRTNNNNSVSVWLMQERVNDNISSVRWQNYMNVVGSGYISGASIQQRIETATIDYPTLTLLCSVGTYSLASFDSWSFNNTTALFGVGNSSGTGLHTASQVRIYSFKYSDSTGEMYDLQPVRFTNELGQSEGAMYDRANPTVGMDPDGSPRTDGLYRNRGTGTFTIGPDKTV